MPRRLRPRRPLAWLAALVLSALAAGCGNGGGSGDETAEDPEYVAQVASFDLAVDRDQRFLAALAGSGTGTVVSFGTVELDFVYLGTRDQPIDPPEDRFSARATFLPVAGQKVRAGRSSPEVVKPSEGLGVYATKAVRFDTAGFWGVTVAADLDGGGAEARTFFEVRAEPVVPAPGQPAPRTRNPLAGAEGVDPVAIDSRAQSGAAVPDPSLHATSVAAALDAGRPVVVVISTPTYCVSRFCGPVTDSVERLAGTYGDRAAFVHLEVWEDFEAKRLNPAAAEWIFPGGRGDAQEPWVFLVGADGRVVARWA